MQCPLRHAARAKITQKYFLKQGTDLDAHLAVSSRI
jgi:hypothetical protein